MAHVAVQTCLNVVIVEYSTIWLNEEAGYKRRGVQAENGGKLTQMKKVFIII